MDDDDEFGDLYTDVLTPFVDSHPSIISSSAAISQNPDLNHQNHFYDPNFTTPSNIPNPIAIPKVEKSQDQLVCGASTPFDPNSTASTDVLVQVKNQEVDENVAGVRVLEPQIDGTSRVSEGLEFGEELGNRAVKVEDGDRDVGFIDRGKLEEPEVDVGVGDLGSEPVIPGLSGGNIVPGAVYAGNDQEDTKEARTGDVGGDEDGGGDDWDSDSDDDLQIVLNDKSGSLGIDRNGGMGSDDGDGDNFLIVSDQPHQPIEEQEWGEDPAQGADGERKEAGDAVKTNGGVVAPVGTRIGYNNHLFPSHHSQFKYVRPGAPVVPGGAIVGPGGAPGQIRPPVSMGLVGRGRGDWRPMGIKPVPGMQRPFHSGFGLPAWGNNSSGRGFGSGLEFTLPSHKTAFDIEIDSFEEKPWTNPGIDVSDYFNFGLDEENWKQYCKQMEQLRLEATMQSRIRVYESGRSEQDYDPDLPPELAAAAGMQDATAENANLANTDGGASRARPPIVPTGRAIQVESGYGERLPSIDTRPARMRDSDAIIEIVLQDSGDDDPVRVEGSVNDIPRDDLRGGDDEEDPGQAEFFHHLPQPYNGRRDMVGRRDSFIGSDNNTHREDESFSFHAEGRAPSYSDGTFGTPHDGRRSQGRDRYSHQTSVRDNDVIPCESANVNSAHDEKGKSGEVTDGERYREATSPVSVEVGREPSIEQDLHNELELGDSSVAMEGEETAKDAIVPCDTVQDESPIPSIKRQKLSSRVEQPVVNDIGSVDSLRATRSSDNSKARSGSSRDYLKRHDGGEEEVVQEGRSRRTEDMKRRRDEDDHNFRRKDGHGRDGRQEMDRSRLFTKGREESHISYPYRDWNPNPTHLSRVKIGDSEMSRERDNSIGARQRRDDDSHGRRLKDEDMRKREHVDEIGYRHRSKVFETEKNGKDEHQHSRHRLDNGDWRVHHNKDVGPRHRDKDENFMIHHENLDDSRTRRRKDEEHPRKEQADKEVLHNYRSREDPSRKKRERDDALDQRKREEQPRERDKSVDNHSIRHREESWRQKERDERRVKQPHEEMLSNREREGRNSVRSGRDPEDKSWTGNTKVKDEPKGLGSDKDYPYKDKRRASEHSKRTDRVEEDVFPQPRGRDNFYARDNQFLTVDRNPRHEKSSTHNDRSVNTPDNQLMLKERSRDSKRSKEADRIDQNTLVPSKRKQEDHNTHRSEKVGRKTASEKESGNTLVSAHTSSRDPGQARLSSSTSLSKKPSREYDAPQQRHSSKKHREDAPSDDEKQNLKGRSKLERWTSNKDRDDFPNALSSSSKSKDTSRTYIDLPSEVNEQPDDQSRTVGSVDDQHPVAEERSSHDLEMKDAGPELTSGSRTVESEKVGDAWHLDTVAKLKKRSERFKTPMPTEKDITTHKKVESEALVSTQSETAADAEVKPERPARKRRWISS